MADQQQEQQEAGKASATFVGPPDWYRLYEAGPDAGPKPPAQLTSTFTVFGEQFDPVSNQTQPAPYLADSNDGPAVQQAIGGISWDVLLQNESYNPRLDTERLYEVQADGSTGKFQHWHSYSLWLV